MDSALQNWLPLFENALSCRESSLGIQRHSALRLFNGFTEGCPELVIDLYAHTLVVFDYSNPPLPVETWPPLVNWYCDRISGIHAALLKTRNGLQENSRRGILVFGENTDSKISENDIWYAVDLTLNQDASFYLDTHLLRSWLFEHAAGRDILNTFAYTGSLGIAAAAGGARKVVQCDLNPRFLELAKQSAALNQVAANRHRVMAGDFFSHVAGFKRSNTLFDIIIADPPFFSATEKGQVNLVNQSRRIINKLRPLVRDGGWLIAINNALFVSGADYLHDLQELGRDGYLEIETLISVPDEFTGCPHTRTANWPADPAPFNHPTKIAVLRVRRKPPAIAPD